VKGERFQMKINALTSFAAGILMATTICGVVYLVDGKEVEKGSATKTENQISREVVITDEEMKNNLETKGYVVLTQEEYEAAKALNETKETTPNETNTKTRVIVNVTNGMTSIDVGNMLVEAEMIPNAFAFTKDIENKGLQNTLRPGVFVLDSDMSYDEVISTIFKR
jgi:hypothetical protein